MNEPKPKPKKFLCKRGVAERYGVNVRTVERMSKDGRLPRPIHRGRFPLWDEAELDASDRAAALLPRPRNATSTGVEVDKSRSTQSATA
jgi:predicted DNA-binding transcriptional regulator AlpA